MPRKRTSVLLLSALLSAVPAAFGQGYSDSLRNHEEQQRQAAQAQRDAATRAHDMLLEDMRRNRDRSNQPAPGAGSSAGAEASVVGAAAGIAAFALTAALLHDLFVAGKSPTTHATPGRRLDPSVERWMQDPLNRPGRPHRYDTPDGMISKVCIRPFPGVQTVIYRWDAPDEQARAADIRETPTREHMQFTHPSARGMFIYVSKPAPDHQPSDKVYWLAAHRIGMTGCGHAQAYQIAYHKFGGPPQFEPAASGGPRLRQEEPVENLPPFMRTCQAHHGQAACVCLVFPLMSLMPGIATREYDRAAITAALRQRPGAVEDVARRCKLQF